jgi:hypothetical protein
MKMSGPDIVEMANHQREALEVFRDLATASHYIEEAAEQPICPREFLQNAAENFRRVARKAETLADLMDATASDYPTIESDLEEARRRV